MRIIAEAERRQQAIDEERRRLDTARQELARLHEERLSAVLADRDSAYQQVREAIIAYIYIYVLFVVCICLCISHSY